MVSRLPLGRTHVLPRLAATSVAFVFSTSENDVAPMSPYSLSVAQSKCVQASEKQHGRCVLESLTLEVYELHSCVALERVAERSNSVLSHGGSCGAPPCCRANCGGHCARVAPERCNRVIVVFDMSVPATKLAPWSPRSPLPAPAAGRAGELACAKCVCMRALAEAELNCHATAC